MTTVSPVPSERLATSVRAFMRPGVIIELSTIPASHAITEPPHYVQLDDTAHAALAALAETGVTHLLVAPVPGGAPHGVVAAIDLVELVTS